MPSDVRRLVFSHLGAGSEVMVDENPNLKTIDKWEAAIRGRRFTLWISESDHEPSLYMIHASSEGNRFSLVLDKKKPPRNLVEQQFDRSEKFLRFFNFI